MYFYFLHTIPTDWEQKNSLQKTRMDLNLYYMIMKTFSTIEFSANYLNTLGNYDKIFVKKIFYGQLNFQFKISSVNCFNAGAQIFSTETHKNFKMLSQIYF